jgi:hypothetical protein
MATREVLTCFGAQSTIRRSQDTNYGPKDDEISSDEWCRSDNRSSYSIPTIRSDGKMRAERTDSLNHKRIT